MTNSVTNTPTEPSLEGEKMRQEFEAWAHDVRGESDVSELEPAGWTVWQAAYAAGCAAERERCAKIAESQPTNYAVQNACICYGGSSYPGPIKEALKCYGGIVASAIRGKEK